MSCIGGVGLGWSSVIHVLTACEMIETRCFVHPSDYLKGWMRLHEDNSGTQGSHSLVWPKSQLEPERHSVHGEQSSLRFQGKGTTDGTHSALLHLMPASYRFRGSQEPSLPHGDYRLRQAYPKMVLMN